MHLMVTQQLPLGQYGYKANDIVLLTDDSRDPRRLPTRKNIIDAMYWLVHGAKPHDSLFFHCRHICAA
jgi:metacaspase-1